MSASMFEPSLSLPRSSYIYSQFSHKEPTHPLTRVIVTSAGAGDHSRKSGERTDIRYLYWQILYCSREQGMMVVVRIQDR